MACLKTFSWNLLQWKTPFVGLLNNIYKLIISQINFVLVINSRPIRLGNFIKELLLILIWKYSYRGSLLFCIIFFQSLSLSLSFESLLAFLLYTPLHGMKTEQKIHLYSLKNAHQCLHAVEWRTCTDLSDNITLLEQTSLL